MFVKEILFLSKISDINIAVKVSSTTFIYQYKFSLFENFILVTVKANSDHLYYDT